MIFKKKNTAISIDKYFELVKPKYVYIKITPHKSIRNYNTTNVAKAIALSYKALNQRIRREQKKIWLETNFKISYMIDIYENNTNFYFIVPECFKLVLIKKLKEIWAKATVEEVPPLQPLDINSTIYQMTYKSEDALSIHVDKKDNEPLNQILSVMEVMKDKDRVSIIYNFKPTNQIGWRNRYERTIRDFEDNKVIDRDKSSFSYFSKSLFNFLIETLDIFCNVFGDFLGSNNKRKERTNLSDAIAMAFNKKKELSIETRRKKDLQIINTQIAVCSYSEDKERELNNAISVAQSFRNLDDDNELKYKKCNKKINIEDYNIGTESNMMSTDECSNFIQIPGRSLLEQFSISHIKVQENTVPKKLRSGTKRLGSVIYKGGETEAYLENSYNIGNLPLTIIGPQGGGKTTYIANYAKDCSNAKESTVIIDFIKGCELSEDIEKCVGNDNIISINLADKNQIQGFGFNEITITKNMDSFDKLNLASLQSEQILALVDAIGDGEPLTRRMRRYLSAAANVSFVLGYNSLKNVISCLEDFEIREMMISSLDRELLENLIDEVKSLRELNEYGFDEDKEKCVVGTKNNKIEHILDRVSILRENFKLKYMFNKSLNNNINLVDLMEKGKTIIFKMKEADFPTKVVKNVMVTYIVSKVWLSCQLRGMIHKQPLRCNVIIDEVFQAPTVMEKLEYILPQSRKFGCKFIFSTQYINQLDKILETLIGSGSSFMLLKGSLEKDFKRLENNLKDFEYEDLREMKKFHSLNLIHYSDGYASFISKLPKPVNN